MQLSHDDFLSKARPIGLGHVLNDVCTPNWCGLECATAAVVPHVRLGPNIYLEHSTSPNAMRRDHRILRNRKCQRCVPGLLKVGACGRACCDQMWRYELVKCLGHRVGIGRLEGEAPCQKVPAQPSYSRKQEICIICNPDQAPTNCSAPRKDLLRPGATEIFLQSTFLGVPFGGTILLACGVLFSSY